MKNFLNKLVNKLVLLYAAHGKFHALVVAVEMAVVSFLTSYSGGLPSTKAGWIGFAAGLGGAAWGATKGWLVDTRLVGHFADAAGSSIRSTASAASAVTEKSVDGQFI